MSFPTEFPDALAHLFTNSIVKLPTKTLVFGDGPDEKYVLTPTDNDTLKDNKGVIYADLQTFVKHKKFGNPSYVQYKNIIPKSVIRFMKDELYVSELPIGDKILIVVSRGTKHAFYWTDNINIWTEDGQQAAMFTVTEYETFLSKIKLLGGVVDAHWDFARFVKQ